MMIPARVSTTAILIASMMVGEMMFVTKIVIGIATKPLHDQGLNPKHEEILS